MVSSMEFTDLQEDCLRLILSHFQSVQFLLELRLVSRRFQAVAEGLLRTVLCLNVFPNAGRVRSYLNALSVHNLHDEPCYRLNDPTSSEIVLQIDDYTLEQSLPSSLTRLLPNVTQLVYVLKLGNNFDLDALLEPWTSTLESLTFFGNLAGYEPLSIEVISNLSKLKRLELFNFDLARIDVTRLVPVLGRLEHFGLYNYIEPLRDLQTQFPDRINPFLEALTPTVCRRLALNQVTFSVQALTSLVRNCPSLFANLTHLSYSTKETGPLECSGMSQKALALIGGHCPNLTFLQTNYKPEFSLSQFFLLLSFLPNLRELKLHFSNISDLNELNFASIEQHHFPHLRHLHLSFITQPSDASLRHLSNTFPFLKQLTIVSQEAIRPVSNLLQDSAIRLHSLDNLEIPERFLESITAYNLVAIDTELARLSMPTCRISPLVAFSTFYGRFEEIADVSFAKIETRRHHLANILNAYIPQHPVNEDQGSLEDFLYSHIESSSLGQQLQAAFVEIPNRWKVQLREHFRAVTFPFHVRLFSLFDESIFEYDWSDTEPLEELLHVIDFTPNNWQAGNGSTSQFIGRLLYSWKSSDPNLVLMLKQMIDDFQQKTVNLFQILQMGRIKVNKKPTQTDEKTGFFFVQAWRSYLATGQVEHPFVDLLQEVVKSLDK